VTPCRHPHPALLSVRVREATDDDALVALDDATGEAAILGTLVLDGTAIAAVAVRPRRRGQGVGTALVRAAAGRCPARRNTLITWRDTV